MSQTLLKNVNTSNRTPVCQSLTSVYNRMVSFGTKIRLIPNVSHACTLVYAIKYTPLHTKNNVLEKIFLAILTQIRCPTLTQYNKNECFFSQI